MRTPQELGHVLLAFREAENRSQEEMAHRCGVTQEMWSRLERGKQRLTLTLVQHLAQRLEISLAVLLDLPHHPRDLQEWIVLGSQLSPKSRQLLRPLFEHFRHLEQQGQQQQEEEQTRDTLQEDHKEEPP